jgi:hypothetical protein
MGALTEGQWTALAELLSQPRPAFLVTSMSVQNLSEEPSADWTLSPSPGAVWTRSANGLALNYQSNAYDSGEGPVHLSSVNASNNYSITGAMTQDGDAITVQTHTVLYLEYNLHLFGHDAVSHACNLIDEAWTATYQISPGERAGDFKVVLTDEKPVSNNDQQLNSPIRFGDGSPLLGPCAQDAVSNYDKVLAAVLSKSANPHSLIPPGGGPGPQPHQPPTMPIFPDDPAPPSAPTVPVAPTDPDDPIVIPHNTRPPGSIPTGRHQK